MLQGKVVYQSPNWKAIKARLGGFTVTFRRVGTLMAACALFLAGACTKKTPTLNLLVWEGYADPSFVRSFEEQYHCKVTASYMGSSDELVDGLDAARGGCGYAACVASPE